MVKCAEYIYGVSCKRCDCWFPLESNYYEMLDNGTFDTVCNICKNEEIKLESERARFAAYYKKYRVKNKDKIRKYQQEKVVKEASIKYILQFHPELRGNNDLIELKRLSLQLKRAIWKHQT